MNIKIAKAENRIRGNRARPELVQKRLCYHYCVRMSVRPSIYHMVAGGYAQIFILAVLLTLHTPYVLLKLFMFY